MFLALYTPTFAKKKVLFPIPAFTQQQTTYFRELAIKGAFKPLIDRSYPLEQIVEAHRYVDSGQKVGNVLMEIGH